MPSLLDAHTPLGERNPYTLTAPGREGFFVRVRAVRRAYPSGKALRLRASTSLFARPVGREVFICIIPPARP